MKNFHTDTFKDEDWEYYFASYLYLHPHIMMNIWTMKTICVFLSNPITNDSAYMEVIIKSQYLASQGQFNITLDADKISPEMKEQILNHLGRELVKHWANS